MNFNLKNLQFRLLVAGTMLIPLTVQAQEGEQRFDPPAIFVSGTGEAAGAPDMAQISLGVVTDSESAKDAVERNSEAMKSLLENLKESGIEARDIQTSNFNVSPRFQRDRNQNFDEGKIIGYRVTNQVTIRIRDLKSIGTTLDQVVASGANQIHGIRFYIEKPDGLQDEARKNAMLDARRRAENLASQAGVKLGRILEIRDQGGQHFPMPHARMAMAESSVPIESGEQMVNVNVQVVYEIQQ